MAQSNQIKDRLRNILKEESGGGKYYDLPKSVVEEMTAKRIRTMQRKYGDALGSALVGAALVGGRRDKYYRLPLEADLERAAKNPWLRFLNQVKPEFENNRAQYGDNWVTFIKSVKSEYPTWLANEIAEGRYKPKPK